MVINTFPPHMTIINNIYLHFQPLEGLPGAHGHRRRTITIIIRIIILYHKRANKKEYTDQIRNK